MKNFLFLYVCKRPFLGTGHLTVVADSELIAKELFCNAFPQCSIQAILELR